MKGLCKLALVALVVAACGGDVGITEPVAPTAAPPMSGGILALGVDSTTGASIETNRDDYSPGEVVHVVGRGWAPGETVNLHMTENPDTHADVDTNVVADASGAFTAHYYDVQTHDLGVTFTLTATGATSHSVAVATFTDAVNLRIFGSSDGSTEHETLAAEEDLGSVTFGNSLTLTCPRGTGLVVRAPGAGNDNQNWSLAYGGAGSNNAALSPLTTLNPSSGTLAGANDTKCVGMTVTTGTLVSGTTYHGSLQISGAGANSSLYFFRFTVLASNTAPTLTGVPTTAQSIPELTLYTFDANATDSDVPAQTLTLSIVGSLPTGATFNTSTGVFEWIPTEAQGPSGAHTFTVRVSDGTVNTDQLVTLNVTEVNAAPALQNVPASATISEDVLYTFDASATDGDDPVQTLVFSLQSAPSGAAINASTGVFTWTPTEAQGPNSFTFDVRVFDGVVHTTQSITLTVSEANASPSLTGVPSTPSIPELANYTFDANATDGDLPAQTLTFSLVSEPTGASINATTGAFSWTPTEAQGPGSYPFTVRVSDGVADTDVPITITVTEVNVAPVLGAINNKSGPELSVIGFTATASDADVPANTLTFSLANPASGTFPTGAVITAGGAFTWTPTEAQGPGVFRVKVVVSDGTDSDEEEIQITVNEVNAAPVLAAIGNQSGNELTAITFDANASDSDIPANALTYSLDPGAPAGATINPTTGAFSWTPGEADGPGDFSLTVRVTDDGAPNLSDSETISIHVNEVNVAPVLGAIGPKSGNEESLITFTATASDADLPANALTFSLGAGAPAGAAITAGGVFTWTPTEAQGPNDYSVKVIVTDNGTPSMSAEETISIHVDEVNVAPVLVGIGAKGVDEGSLLTFDANATDADLPANSLTYSLDAGAPAGASINSTTGVFSWTPTNGPAQSQNITIRVTDNGTGALSDFETIAVTVNNIAPTIGTINFVSAPIAAGTNNVVVTWNFSDPGTETWKCWIEWDSGSGFVEVLYTTPNSCNATATLPAGIYTTRVKVTDDVGNDIEDVSAYIVVYDPNGGFVTGGGWINSLPGFYRLNTAAQGKANFGFVSKYQPGRTVPTGNTEFQFHAGDLNFKSTVYEWLVVAGTKAMYKGEGTIAGRTGVYGFLLSAIDGSPDKFRIKIWEKTSEDVVYDTLLGDAADDAEPTTTLGGGSIVVHTKK
jgi:hypothetical protein